VRDFARSIGVTFKASTMQMDTLPLPADLVEYISLHMRATQLQAAVRGYRVRARLLQLCEGRADWVCADDVIEYLSGA